MQWSAGPRRVRKLEPVVGRLLRWSGVIRGGLVGWGVYRDYFFYGLHDFVGVGGAIFRERKFQLAVVTDVVIGIADEHQIGSVLFDEKFGDPKFFAGDEFALRDTGDLLIGRREFHAPRHIGAEAHGDRAVLIGVGGGATASTAAMTRPSL